MPEKLEASVQYGDMHGTVAADWTIGGGLSAMAREAGIDTDEFFVFGVEIYAGENGWSEVSFLAVETAVVGSSFAPIQRYIDENGTLPYVRLGCTLKLEDVVSRTKRLNSVMTNRFKNVSSYELQG